MQVGIDTFSVHPLKMDEFKTLDWIKQHSFAGGLFGGLAGGDLGKAREILAHAQKLGIYCDISTVNCNPTTAKGSFEEHVAEGIRQIEAAAACGWHELHSSLGGIDERYTLPARWTEQLAAATTYIRRLSPALRANKCRINLETHGDTTTFELIRMIEDAGPDALGICLDTANLLCNCEDPVSAARRAAPYVHMTHIKDATIHFIDTGYRRQTLPPGRGALDWEKILPILAEHSPNLRLSIEDHKWLFDFHVFDPHWLRLHPDITVAEYGLVMKFAKKCDDMLKAGKIADIQEYDKIPHLEEVEPRLNHGRDHLNSIIARQGLQDKA